MADIFVSYASEDRARASALAAAFEALGWSVWWDRQIRSGSDFTKAIGRALHEARVVVVLWSASSIESAWVRDEASEGLKRQVLVAASLDGAEPPLGFRSFQSIALGDWDGDRAAPAFRRLAEDIAAMLGAAPAPLPPSTAPPPADAARRAGTKRALVVGIALAVALIAAASYGAYVWQRVERERTEALARQRLVDEQARIAAEEAARRAAALEAERVKRAGSPEPAAGVASPSPALRLSDTQLDFRSREIGAEESTRIPQRIVFTNLGEAPLAFRLDRQGPDSAAFRILDGSCRKTGAGGISVDKSCWLAWSFIPARTGPHAERLVVALADRDERHTIELSGTGLPASGVATGAAVKIDSSSCTSLGTARWRIALGGTARAPAGAFFVANSSPNNGVGSATTTCSHWGKALAADGARNQNACKRSDARPEDSRWTTSAVFTARSGSTAAPGTAIARVYLADADGGRYRELARDSVPLDCR